VRREQARGGERAPEAEARLHDHLAVAAQFEIKSKKSKALHHILASIAETKRGQPRV
jgi:hypothetical protein